MAVETHNGAKSNIDLINDVIKILPPDPDYGLTAEEIAFELGLGTNTIRPRLSDAAIYDPRISRRRSSQYHHPYVYWRSTAAFQTTLTTPNWLASTIEAIPTNREQAITAKKIAELLQISHRAINTILKHATPADPSIKRAPIVGSNAFTYWREPHKYHAPPTLTAIAGPPLTTQPIPKTGYIAPIEREKELDDKIENLLIKLKALNIKIKELKADRLEEQVKEAENQLKKMMTQEYALRNGVK